MQLKAVMLPRRHDLRQNNGRAVFNVDTGLNRGGYMVCVGKINDDLSGISLSHPRNNQQGFWLAITVYSPTILSGEHYL